MTKKHAITLLLLLSLMLLSACGTRRPAPVEDRGSWKQRPTTTSRSEAYRSSSYTVMRGDTLYSISFRYNLDWRELARWNQIRSPYLIHPGDRLRLTAPPQVASTNQRPRSNTNSTIQSRPSSAASTGSASGRSPPSNSAGSRPSTGSMASSSASSRPPASQPATTKKPKPSDSARATPPSSKPITKTSPRSSGSSTATSPAKAPPKAATKNSNGVKWRWPANGPVLRSFKANSTGREGLDIKGDLGEVVRAAADGTVVYSGTGLIGYGELIIIKHNERLLSAYGYNRKRLVKEGEKVTAGQAISEMGQNSSGQVVLHFEIRLEGKTQNPRTYLPKR
jgi:lipoprotein NlpD